MNTQLRQRIDRRVHVGRQPKRGGRLARTLESATRRNGSGVLGQPQKWRVLGARLPRRQQRGIRTVALPGAGVLFAAMGAAEGVRRGRELRRLGEQMERLADAASGRARRRASARLRRRVLIAGAAAGVLGGTAATVIAARRLCQTSAAAANAVGVAEETEATVWPDATAAAAEHPATIPPEGGEPF